MIFSQSRKEAVSDMKEYKVGDEITLVVKEVKEDNFAKCNDCFFKGINETCQKDDLACAFGERSDGKNVIFVEKGK